MHLVRLDSGRLAGEPSGVDMPALETYYRWVGQMRKEGRRWHQEPCPEQAGTWNPRSTEQRRIISAWFGHRYSQFYSLR
jgi:hypothetical protein